MKRIGIPLLLLQDPFETRWTTLSDFEHWFAKHLAENNMEADKIEVMGSPQLIYVIKAKKIPAQVTQPKPTNTAPKKQFENLMKGIK